MRAANPISASEVGSDARAGVGERNSTGSARRTVRVTSKADRVGPGKDVRERIEAGSVEMDEQEARRWTVPFVKDPNVARRGD